MRSYWAYRVVGLAVGCGAFISCASDRIEFVALKPEPVPGVEDTIVRQEDLSRIFEIVDEIAVSFGFRRLQYSPEGERIQADSLVRMGYENAPQYGRSDRAAYMLLQIGVPTSRSQVTVAASLVRGGSASDATFLSDVQDVIADRLRVAFPRWSVQRDSGEIDRTFAP